MKKLGRKGASANVQNVLQQQHLGQTSLHRSVQIEEPKVRDRRRKKGGQALLQKQQLEQQQVVRDGHMLISE
jgi:hypothetical protein